MGKTGLLELEDREGCCGYCGTNLLPVAPVLGIYDMFICGRPYVIVYEEKLPV